MGLRRQVRENGVDIRVEEVGERLGRRGRSRPESAIGLLDKKDKKRCWCAMEADPLCCFALLVMCDR